MRLRGTLRSRPLSVTIWGSDAWWWRSWPRRRPGPATSRWSRPRWTGCPSALGRPRPSGRWGSRPGSARWSATARRAARGGGGGGGGRRQARPIDAREQLGTACDMLDAMGMAAFAERARRELAATAKTARKRAAPAARAAGAGEPLTAQEAQVALLARDGLSNQEIGARLFISPRTVKYHLHKVFTKLGISSRGQLYRVLPADPGG